MKQIAILGSTGSIGRQALDVIASHPDEYEVYALTANNSVDLLIEQALKFKPEAVVIANEEHYGKLRDALAGQPVKVLMSEVPSMESASSVTPGSKPVKLKLAPPLLPLTTTEAFVL